MREFIVREGLRSYIPQWLLTRSKKKAAKTRKTSLLGTEPSDNVVTDSLY